MQRLLCAVLKLHFICANYCFGSEKQLSGIISSVAIVAQCFKKGDIFESFIWDSLLFLNLTLLLYLYCQKKLQEVLMDLAALYRRNILF